MTIDDIQSYLETTEEDFLLYQERNFDKRIEIIDFIEFQIIDSIEELLRKTTQPDKLILLKHHAEKVKSNFEEIDSNLFKKLQHKIRTEKCRGKEFTNLLKEYLDFNSDDYESAGAAGYGNLDIFINGLFSNQNMPEQSKELEPEMVSYQKTPARIVFELVKQCQFKKEDIFFDVGSGLGQAAILVNLLAEIPCKGVELEAAFCEYATKCAKELDLPNVTFVNADAREANYADGTVFFLYTPFKGKIMQEVLELLKKESLLRKIKIITYGPCTADIALQSWLYTTEPKDDNIYKLGIFAST